MFLTESVYAAGCCWYAVNISTPNRISRAYKPTLCDLATALALHQSKFVVRSLKSGIQRHFAEIKIDV